MANDQTILLLGDSLYLHSLAAGLREGEGFEILPPGSDRRPDLILLAIQGQDNTPALDALARYPDVPILRVDQERQRLTLLRASPLTARSFPELRAALRALAPTLPKETSDEA